jgi:hypothetical protein
VRRPRIEAAIRHVTLVAGLALHGRYRCASQASAAGAMSAAVAMVTCAEALKDVRQKREGISGRRPCTAR